MKKVKAKTNSRGPKGPVKMLEAELLELRRDFRATLRAYSARLEIDLAQTNAAVGASKSAEELSREQLHNIRDLTALLRNRRVKPEKGRRKDLRTIDSLIDEVHSIVHNGRNSKN